MVISVVRAQFAVAVLAAGIGVALVGGVVALGADDAPTRVEKLEYDPSAGRWVDEAPPVPGTPEGDLRLARARFAEGEHRDAYKQIKDWIKAYGETHALYPQAAILRAEMLIARRDYYKAHERLQEFLNEYAGTVHADRAVELEFVVAEVFLGGTRRKVWGMRVLGAEDTGIAMLDDLVARFPESRGAEAAAKTKADHYYRKGDFVLAEMEYAMLVRDFPRSRYMRYSTRRSAESALASFPGIEFDDAALIEAEERYRDYVALYPGSAEQEGIGLILEDVASQRAAKEFDIGRYYERTDHPKAAAFYYRSTIEHWPNTIAATRARDRLQALGLTEDRPEVASSFSETASEGPAVGQGANP